MTADIFFLHDRGKWNTLYWVVYIGSIFVGPIVSGCMTAHVSWRNFWWLNTAMTTLSLVMVIFMFPETKWHRDNIPVIPQVPSTSLNEPTIKVQQPAMVDCHVESLISSSLDHKSTAAKDATQFVILETAGDAWLGRGRPNRQQWGFYTPTPRLLRSVLLDLWLPWTLFPVPIVLFAAFTITWNLSSFLFLNLTQAQVFAAPPYLWSIQIIGFTNFAMLVGALIGLFTAGRSRTGSPISSQ